MKKSEFKQIIRECVREILKESVDPTKQEMLSYLQTLPYASEDGFPDSAEVAIYWFTSDWHGGQSSNLYSTLSTSPYKPSHMTSSINDEDDEIAKMLYSELEDKYFPGQR